MLRRKFLFLYKNLTDKIGQFVVRQIFFSFLNYKMSFQVTILHDNLTYLKDYIKIHTRFVELQKMELSYIVKWFPCYQKYNQNLNVL